MPVAKQQSAVLSKVCSADPKGSATISRGIRGYISVTATFKFTYSFIEGIMFCYKYWRIFISY
jgi:hypothetical protein